MGALNSPQHIYAFGVELDDLIPTHVMLNQNLSITTCVILMITLVFSSEIPAERTDQQLSELEFVEASNTSPRVARLVDPERLLGIKFPHSTDKAKAEFGKKVKKAEGHLEDSLKTAVAKAKKKEADAKKSKKALKAKLKAKVKKMAAKVHAAKKKGAKGAKKEKKKAKRQKAKA